jgi:hypothetical protein
MIASDADDPAPTFSMAGRRSSVANPNSISEPFTHGNIRYRPTRAVVVWIEFIDFLHAVEGKRDRTDGRRKLDYRRLPCVQLMMIPSPVALLVGRTNAIASTRLE